MVAPLGIEPSSPAYETGIFTRTLGCEIILLGVSGLRPFQEDQRSARKG